MYVYVCIYMYVCVYACIRIYMCVYGMYVWLLVRLLVLALQRIDFNKSAMKAGRYKSEWVIT